MRARQAYGTRTRFLSARGVPTCSVASQTTNARLLFAKRVASGRETYGCTPKDPPRATIAMGRLASRVREQDSCIRCQKWPFCEFRLKIRYILRRSAPPSRATYRLGTLADLFRPREPRTLAYLLGPQTHDLFAGGRPGRRVSRKKVRSPGGAAHLGHAPPLYNLRLRLAVLWGVLSIRLLVAASAGCRAGGSEGSRRADAAHRTHRHTEASCWNPIPKVSFLGTTRRGNFM